MNKKTVAVVAIICLALWFYLSSSISLPKKISFQGSVYSLAANQSRNGAKIGSYVLDGESVAQFSKLMMISAWPSSTRSISDFDIGVRKVFQEMLHGILGAENDRKGSCWLLTQINPPQVVYTAYQDKEKIFSQVSYTKVRSADEKTDAATACSDFNEISQDLNKAIK